MPIAVKWFDNTMRGAPTINGVAGAMIAALDACLITGFGPVTATGITVSGGVATATVPSGQSFAQHAVVLVSGATPTALNGEARVLTSSSTQITFSTTAANGAASGTIEIRYAPVGNWEKVFTGTNKAAYRSLDVTSPRHYLRVDDTGTTKARVRGFESMTDVDTGTEPFPTDSQMSGGGYWPKVASAGNARWKLFGDSRFFALAVAPGSASSANWVNAPARGFGDPIPLRPAGDVWCTVLSAGSSTVDAGNGTVGAFDYVVQDSSSAGLIAAPRVWQGIGGSVLLNPKSWGLAGASSPSVADNAMGAFPSAISGGLILSPLFVAEAAPAPPRATVPGIYRIPQTGVVSILADGDTVDGTGPFAGRLFRMVATGGAMNANAGGMYAVDITGPWR